VASFVMQTIVVLSSLSASSSWMVRISDRFRGEGVWARLSQVVLEAATDDHRPPALTPRNPHLWWLDTIDRSGAEIGCQPSSRDDCWRSGSVSLRVWPYHSLARCVPITETSRQEANRFSCLALTLRRHAPLVTSWRHPYIKLLGDVSHPLRREMNILPRSSAGRAPQGRSTGLRRVDRRGDPRS